MKAETFSSHYLAGAFDIDRATAVRVLKGIEPDQTVKGRGTFTIATFARALEAHHLANASNNGGGNANSDIATSLTQARIRIANASAEKRERENQIARGELVTVANVLDVLAPDFLTLREIALSLPGVIGDALVAHCPGADYAAIFAIVNREVRANLETLASPQSYIERAADGDDVAQSIEGGDNGPR
jgi:hypothetical protein